MKASEDVKKSNLQCHKAIQERTTGTIIFFIPESDDVMEKKEVFEEQIVGHLVRYANMLGSYQQAIVIVQGYLKAMIRHYPEEAQLIKIAAQNAGEKFLKIVDEAKSRSMREKIERGEMFLGVKRISGGEQHGNYRND